MAVRTRQLALQQVQINAGASATLYTVPAGRVTILRCVLLNLTSATAAAIDERVANTQVRKPSLTQNVVDVFEVWRVMKAGDTYVLRNQTAAQVTVTAWLSGAELVL